MATKPAKTQVCPEFEKASGMIERAVDLAMSWQPSERGLSYAERRREVTDLLTNALRFLPGQQARPASEYHEDMGAVLWWKFPIVEPPYFGDPRDLGHPVEVVVRHYENEGKVAETVHRHLVGGWPEYHTHFTTISLPTPPSIEKSGGEK